MCVCVCVLYMFILMGWSLNKSTEVMFLSQYTPWMDDLAEMIGEDESATLGTLEGVIFWTFQKAFSKFVHLTVSKAHASSVPVGQQ